MYATDVAKMVQAPIFHVNGDDPEACVRVARLAFGFRQAFHKDVVIDMVCYRRFGHNEGDDPSYTQPQMYERIESRRSVRKLYTEALVNRGDITLEEAEKALEDFSARLQAGARRDRASRRRPRPPSCRPAPRRSACRPTVDTGVDRERARPRRRRRCTRRPTASPCTRSWPSSSRPRAKLYAEGEVDWALGEALAFGSLLLEGTDIRLVRPGHPAGHVLPAPLGAGRLRDRRASTCRSPTSTPDQGRFCVYDSLLSEYAALGFEYGYSVVHKDALVAWEAQFGDFVNGAQIVIDQFIAAAEDKWDQTSGLVLLLPHGYEGQGPEHSLGPHRALPHAVRRGQHAGRQRHDRRRSTSTCCAARCTATCASR